MDNNKQYMGDENAEGRCMCEWVSEKGKGVVCAQKGTPKTTVTQSNQHKDIQDSEKRATEENEHLLHTSQHKGIEEGLEPWLFEVVEECCFVLFESPHILL